MINSQLITPKTTILPQNINALIIILAIGILSIFGIGIIRIFEIENIYLFKKLLFLHSFFLIGLFPYFFLRHLNNNNNPLENEIIFIWKWAKRICNNLLLITLVTLVSCILFMDIAFLDTKFLLTPYHPIILTLLFFLFVLLGIDSLMIVLLNKKSFLFLRIMTLSYFLLFLAESYFVILLYKSYLEIPTEGFNLDFLNENGWLPFAHLSTHLISNLFFYLHLYFISQSNNVKTSSLNYFGQKLILLSNVTLLIFLMILLNSVIFKGPRIAHWILAPATFNSLFTIVCICGYFLNSRKPQISFFSLIGYSIFGGISGLFIYFNKDFRSAIYGRLTMVAHFHSFFILGLLITSIIYFKSQRNKNNILETKCSPSSTFNYDRPIWFLFALGLIIISIMTTSGLNNAFRRTLIWAINGESVLKYLSIGLGFMILIFTSIYIYQLYSLFNFKNVSKR